MHGWVELSVGQLVVLVGADVDERGDVAVVGAADTHRLESAASVKQSRRLGGGATYFSRVMMSSWPVKCRARRRARSLASELRFRGGKGHASY